MFVKLQIAARDPKTKVSIFSLLFGFRWFLAEIAIIPVPPIVNLQKKRSEYEFSRKVRGGLLSKIIFFSRCLWNEIYQFYQPFCFKLRYLYYMQCDSCKNSSEIVKLR